MDLINSDDLKKLSKAIQPVIDLGGVHRWQPLEHPINLSVEDFEELELLHYNLDTLLYQLKLGEIEKELKTGDISFDEYAQKVEKVSKEAPYRFI